MNDTVGHVYKKVSSNVTREDPTPDRWVLRNGQWWYAPDSPEQKCVRYNQGFVPTSLAISRDEFLSRFFSEVERIHPYLSPFDKGNGLIEFEFVSEEYEEIEGGSYFAIFEQRLPRMQPVVTYEIPAPPIPGMHINASTTLRMFGEAHALTKVVLNAYEDHLSPDPWTRPRQFTYFRALGGSTRSRVDRGGKSSWLVLRSSRNRHRDISARFHDNPPPAVCIM